MTCEEQIAEIERLTRDLKRLQWGFDKLFSEINVVLHTPVEPPTIGKSPLFKCFKTINTLLSIPHVPPEQRHNPDRD